MRKILMLVLTILALFTVPVLAENYEANLSSKLVVDYQNMHLTNTLDMQFKPLVFEFRFKGNAVADWMPAHISQTFKLNLEEMYIAKDFSYANLVVGRKHLDWGPGYFSGLVLGKPSPLQEKAPSLDLAGYGLKIGPFYYQRYYSVLEMAGNKQWLGHRLEASLVPGLTLGVSETAVTYGKIDPLFYNPFPLWPYYVSQHLITPKDHEQIMERVNCAVAGDFKYILRNKSVLYGELYVDDAPQRVTDNIVDKRGGLAGFYNPYLTSNADLRVEYARIHNFVYAHRGDVTQYTQNGELLGHVSGPDSDMLSIESNIRLNTANHVILGLNIHQKGAGTVLVDWEEDPNWRKDKFLSGTVEKTYEVKIGMENFINGIKNYSCSLSLYHADNYKNVQGETNSGFKLLFEKDWSL